MSRIGKLPITVPSGVEVVLDGQDVSVKGPKGTLSLTVREPISVSRNDAGEIEVSRPDDERNSRALHGLTRTLVSNMVTGVTQGYEKKLELQGVGYIAAIQGSQLQLRVGLANELHKEIPPGLTVTCPDQQHVLVKGIDKQQVTQFAAEVRALRKAEPYKGKGIRYDGEAVRRKQGKVMAK